MSNIEGMSDDELRAYRVKVKLRLDSIPESDFFSKDPIKVALDSIDAELDHRKLKRDFT